MPVVRAFKFGDKAAPPFPDDFEIVRKAVLQATDLKTNHNKYYAVELHVGKKKGRDCFRIFTHYGRTDDLETNPEAGQKECRFFSCLEDAQGHYELIYREKTSPRKGYREVNLASTKIGSAKARGTASGQVDAATLAKLGPKAAKVKASVKALRASPTTRSKLHPSVQGLVRYIYDEAKTAMTDRVAVQITARGLETPLGILTLGQIDKGEDILVEIHKEMKKAKRSLTKLRGLSSDFFTTIPHRIGRTRDDAYEAIIDTLKELNQRQETLQLMRDMLTVNGDGGGVLYNARVDQEYEALGCQLQPVERKDPEYKKIEKHVVESQVSEGVVDDVVGVYRVRRPDEWRQFAGDLGNHQMLFHGSRISNWVGILSRGILLPKIVVSMGVDRTDEGWLGSGIYFGSAACVSAMYTSAGKTKTSFLAVARVALGKVKDFYNIKYGLRKPPPGFHSCHGVRCDDGVDSEFDDDEYVIYDNRQQRIEYLVEFKNSGCSLFD